MKYKKPDKHELNLMNSQRQTSESKKKINLQELFIFWKLILIGQMVCEGLLLGCGLVLTLCGWHRLSQFNMSSNEQPFPSPVLSVSLRNCQRSSVFS